MIINTAVKPQDTVYYISACIIEMLNKQSFVADELYEEVKKAYNPKLEYQTFLSAIHFSFLLEKINLNKEGLLICI